MIFPVENNKYMTFYSTDHLTFHLVFVPKKSIDVINLSHAHMDFFLQTGTRYQKYNKAPERNMNE